MTNAHTFLCTQSVWQSSRSILKVGPSPSDFPGKIYLIRAFRVQFSGSIDLHSNQHITRHETFLINGTNGTHTFTRPVTTRPRKIRRGESGTEPAVPGPYQLCQNDQCRSVFPTGRSTRESASLHFGILSFSPNKLLQQNWNGWSTLPLRETTRKSLRFHSFRPCAFFFYVSRHFFFTKPTRARGKKCPKKKKRTGSLWPTNDAPTVAHCVEHSPFFFLNCFLFPNDDKVKQLPVATIRKFDFCPVAFRGQRTLLTLFNWSTSRTHSSSRPEITR